MSNDRLIPGAQLETVDRRSFVAMVCAHLYPIERQKDMNCAIQNTLRQANELADAVFGMDANGQMVSMRRQPKVTIQDDGAGNVTKIEEAP